MAPRDATLVEVSFYPPKGMEGYRLFRIEYGEGFPEGIMYLPPGVNPGMVEWVMNPKELDYGN